jgi:hypothetical protein
VARHGPVPFEENQPLMQKGSPQWLPFLVPLVVDGSSTFCSHSHRAIYFSFSMRHHPKLPATTVIFNFHFSTFN